MSAYARLTAEEAGEKMAAGCPAAAHALVYTVREPARRLWEMELRADAVIILRHDGRLGLIGGGVERGESPEKALVRELKEEVGLDLAAVAGRDGEGELDAWLRRECLADIRLRRAGEREVVLFGYGIRIAPEAFDELVVHAMRLAEHAGTETWGVVMVPLFAAPGTSPQGLPFFLTHPFVYNARQQLLSVLKACNLVPLIPDRRDLDADSEARLRELLTRAKHAIAYQARNIEALAEAGTDLDYDGAPPPSHPDVKVRAPP
jgi:8-oxo-dGTP pyrophosphatase MutT (NUDIX family)